MNDQFETPNLEEVTPMGLTPEQDTLLRTYIRERILTLEFSTDEEEMIRLIEQEISARFSFVENMK